MVNKHQNIPKGWRFVELGEFVAEISERHENKDSNGKSVLSVTNKPGFAISEEFFNRKVFSKDLANYKVIREGQFAYNPSRVNVGSIARLKERKAGLLSPMYVVFKTNDGLEGDYLDYWIQSRRFRSLVKASTQGTVRDSLNFSALEEFPFLLPPVIEQKRIISILSTIDFVISKTQAVIDQTQTLKKGLMQELFTRGIPGRHKKFKKTEIGLIPEDWEVKKLTECCIQKPEYGANISAEDYDPNLPRYIRITDLSDEGELLGGNKQSIAYEFAKDYLLSDGDFLFARSGATVGKTYLYKSKDGYCAFAGYLIRFKTNKKILLPGFLFYITHSPRYYRWVTNILRAGAQPNINASEYSKFVIQVPPIDEQKEMVDILESFNMRVGHEKHAVDTLQMVKSALMQVLLTGKVRVKV